MSRQCCQICGNDVLPYDFATISPLGMICGCCWARQGLPGPKTILLDSVENPSRAMAMPEALELLMKPAG